jgi:Holliday junction resolvase RusA-like endonuclease
MELLKLNLPLNVFTTKSKTKKSKYILNLNNFRNAHFRKNASAKIAYKEEVENIVPKGFGYIIYTPLRFTYTLYPKTRRRTDVSNPLSIIDKFTCDALVELGIIPDDNYTVIGEVVYKFGEVDKENPRAELSISTLDDIWD